MYTAATSRSVPVVPKFTGKERDLESGLDYFIARHYSSTIGRFLQVDEFAGGPVDAFSSNDPLPPGPLPYADITNPQSLNKYTYTYNNPLTYVDPDGHSVWTKLGKFLMKGGDVAATFASMEKDIGTATDSNASDLDRVEAAGRAASEFLPFSASDAGDLGQLAGEGLAKIDEAGGVGAAAIGVVKGGTYTLRDPETDEVMRSGQTNDLNRRKREHARGKETQDLKFQVDKRSDSRSARLGREQQLHERHNPPLNKRNPISPNNPKRNRLLEAAKKLFVRKAR